MRVLLLAGVLAALALPAEAAAGGWWSFVQLDRNAAAPGQRVTAQAEVLFATSAAARRVEAEGGYFVYALRRLDAGMVERAMTRANPGDWWRLGGAEAVELGQVAVTAVDGNLARARASFVLPDLPLGRYALMLCSAGCARPLADLVPTRGFQVVADPATARLGERIDRLDRRAYVQARRLAAARAAVAAVRREARAAVEALEARVAALERRPAEAVPAARVPLVAWAGWLLAGALLGAFGVLAVRRRRPPAGPSAWPGDEELAALLRSERPRQRLPAGRR